MYSRYKYNAPKATTRYTRSSGNQEKTRFIQHMNIGISRPLFCAKGMSKMLPRAMLKNIQTGYSERLENTKHILIEEEETL
jgi:hypothetical protein